MEELIPIALFAAIFGVFYLYYTTRNRERMALIEKGGDASIFETDKKSGNVFNKVLINFALLAIGIGLGIFSAALLENYGINDDVAYPAMIFIFAGLALLGGFFVSRKLDKEA
ncbi:MAG: DUF6249 domain-containing protein [Cyclobacteriaceae bacterium]